VDSALTIAFPTYNRAALLDRQLAWLSRALTGHERDCEILVSDNASADETPDIVRRWRNLLSRRGASVRVNRNAKNVTPRTSERFGTSPSASALRAAGMCGRSATTT